MKSANFPASYETKFRDAGAPALLDTAGTIGSTIVNSIIVFVLTFMMLVEGPMWLRRTLKLISARKHRQRVNDVAYDDPIHLVG